MFRKISFSLLAATVLIAWAALFNFAKSADEATVREAQAAPGSMAEAAGIGDGKTTIQSVNTQRKAPALVVKKRGYSFPKD